MSELDLEVKEFIKEAESDSNLKASIERTMGTNWYSKALFQMLSRKYCLGDFTRLREVFYQITQTPLEEAFNIGKKILAGSNYCRNEFFKDYIACEGYSIVISYKRKVINNE